MLSVILTPENFIVPTIAGALFGFAKWLTETLAKIPQSEAVVLGKEPRTVSKEDCLKKVVREKRVD